MKKNHRPEGRSLPLASETKTTPENLEMKLMNNLGTILTFGDRILAAGYFYDPNGRSYYGDVYRFTTEDHTAKATSSWSAFRMRPSSTTGTPWPGR